jgi:hypothetical protein
MSLTLSKDNALFPIESIYFSSQGEGARAGTSNIFVRFKDASLLRPVKMYRLDSFQFYRARFLMEELERVSGENNCKNIVIICPDVSQHPGMFNLLMALALSEYHVALETGVLCKDVRKMDEKDLIGWLSYIPLSFSDGEVYQDSMNEIRINYRLSLTPEILKAVMDRFSCDFFYLFPVCKVFGYGRDLEGVEYEFEPVYRLLDELNRINNLVDTYAHKRFQLGVQTNLLAGMK